MKFPLLREMIRVMKEVHALNLELDMSNWYQGMPKSESLHLCGTAACVCGYAALDEKIRTEYELIGLGSSADASLVENELAEELARLDPNGEWYNGFVIARALTDTSSYGRVEKADKAGLPESLKKLTHVTSDEPTPKDAVEFMEALLAWLESEVEVPA